MSNDAYAAHSSLEKVPSRTSITKSGGDVEAAHIERVDPDTQYDPKFVRSTIRKIDFRLLPILGALYAFSLIDRTNISLARIIGAGAELKLDEGDRYSIIVLLFFIPYILIEWPSNILIRRVGCALWLGCISVLWGSAMLGMGFVKSWYALAGCRVALGAFEAGFFPGCVYLITTWYIRREQQARLAVFYLLSTLVGGFSPIFAYGVSTIGIAYGLYAWRWLFIICGAITIFLGLLAFLLVVDFPDKATFLTPEQIQFVQNRVQYDRGDAIPDELTWAKARGYLTDPKLWGYAFMFMCSTFPSYAYSLFLPILMVGFGFNVRDSQLLIAPPYAFATVFGVIVAFIADRARMRGPFIIFQSLITIIGLSMTAFLTGTYPRYAGAFLGLFGTSSNIPAVLAWSQNNIIGQSQRAYTSALVIGFGGVGGILAGVLFREKDKPKYLPGLWASIASQIIIIFIASALMAWSWYRNKQARAGGKLIQNRPHFYYTL